MRYFDGDLGDFDGYFGNVVVLERRRRFMRSLFELLSPVLRHSKHLFH